MTKEQEEAIKNIETLSEYGLCYAITNEVKEDMKIILDMLKEQEKQISDLKEENMHWRGQYHLLSRKINVIPVKKVQDKIKELNDNKGYLKKFRDWTEKEYTNEDIIQNCIEVLEELLEEK